MFSHVPLCLVCFCAFPYMVALLESYGLTVTETGKTGVVPPYIRAAILISRFLPLTHSVFGLDTHASLPWSYSPDGLSVGVLSYLLWLGVFLWVRSLILEHVWTLICGLTPDLRSYAGLQIPPRLSFTIQVVPSVRVRATGADSATGFAVPSPFSVSMLHPIRTL